MPIYLISQRTFIHINRIFWVNSVANRRRSSRVNRVVWTMLYHHGLATRTRTKSRRKLSVCHRWVEFDFAKSTAKTNIFFVFEIWSIIINRVGRILKQLSIFFLLVVHRIVVILFVPHHQVLISISTTTFHIQLPLQLWPKTLNLKRCVSNWYQRSLQKRISGEIISIVCRWFVKPVIWAR